MFPLSARPPPQCMLRPCRRPFRFPRGFCCFVNGFSPSSASAFAGWLFGGLEGDRLPFWLFGVSRLVVLVPWWFNCACVYHCEVYMMVLLFAKCAFSDYWLLQFLSHHLDLFLYLLIKQCLHSYHVYKGAPASAHKPIYGATPQIFALLSNDLRFTDNQIIGYDLNIICP